ncbi:hypothetical protein J2S40_001947 [Nocardioides luteus]|uniref:Uncharacterized protein n=1 Tax=Nocardioides luteus TaxID=1844 RepID=A0ABQ5T2B9_9ACTN|nr:hypothetical protein [Nocardioides luteus]MDR7310889.1 hypothetical protein [Nocardioides luteus]GGR39952.1 hypothetical protein GCM10010197_01070 [Nocardioides luteus]GLJ69331.1 hypothetical protein GCM10017579_33670 [Nocardioides luteus]
MFTWILIIGGVLLFLGLAWTTIGMAPKGIDPEDVRNIKRDNAGRGDYYGGAGL